MRRAIQTVFHGTFIPVLFFILLASTQTMPANTDTVGPFSLYLLLTIAVFITCVIYFANSIVYFVTRGADKYL